ncbi:MAG: helix-turn-helix transcriptional regulator [Magnetococcales bacterium]|nr:helix-turn-helix transcriptional regulator [Magnetococcales bacterium]
MKSATESGDSSVASRIELARKYRGLTQKTLAQHVGVSQPAIHKWEKGVTNAKRPLETIARICQVNVEWLESGQGLMIPLEGDQEGELASRLPEIAVQVGVLEKRVRKILQEFAEIRECLSRLHRELALPCLDRSATRGACLDPLAPPAPNAGRHSRATSPTIPE